MIDDPSIVFIHRLDFGASLEARDSLLSPFLALVSEVTVIVAKRTALARIFVDDQDLRPLEVDDVRNFLARFESDGEMKAVGALDMTLEGVEPDIFDGSVSCEYSSIILLLQIVMVFPEYIHESPPSWVE